VIVSVALTLYDRISSSSGQSAHTMPMLANEFLVLETLSEVRDEKNSLSISNSECQHATASGVALCLPHDTV
jgi:hypothetical protein